MFEINRMFWWNVVILCLGILLRSEVMIAVGLVNLNIWHLASVLLKQKGGAE